MQARSSLGRKFLLLAQLREGWRFSEMRREIQHIFFHCRMPKLFEMEMIHFIDGVLGRPAIENHAIRREEHTGAVISKPAMDEDHLLRSLLRE